MPPVVVTPPTEEPVSLAELKLSAHIEHSSEDTFLTDTIAAARFRYELDTRRQLMEATYDWFLPCFSSRTNRRGDRIIVQERSFEIPLPPLKSIVSVKYFDTAGVEQTVPDVEYGTKTSSEPGRIYNLPNEEWPDLENDRIEDAVTIRFIAGEEFAVDVPELDRQAILLLAGHWVENREAVVLDDRIRSASVPITYPEIAEGRKIILTG